MDAVLSRLAARAFQSPLYLEQLKIDEDFGDRTLAELIKVGSSENVNEDLLSFLEQCSACLDWALRNRVPPIKTAQAVSGWLENPFKCPDLPIVNRGRFPNVDWEESPRQIGTVEKDRLILLGTEQGTEAAIVSCDNGVDDDYHASYLYEILGQAQGKVELFED